MSLPRLHVSVLANNLRGVKRCLDEGCDVNEQASQGMTGLHYAASRGYLEIASELLNNGADVEVKNNDGLSPLHYCTSSGSLDVTKLLLDHSAQVNSTAKDGQTSLHLAAKQNKLDIASLLIERGADLDIQDCEKCSPLQTAIKDQHVDMCNLLVHYNVDTNLKDNRNMTALHAAVELENIQLVSSVLRIRSTNVNAKTDFDHTALHKASQMNNCEIAKALLDRGASIEAKDKEGHTAVSISKLYSQNEVFDLLNNSKEVIESSKLGRKKKPENIIKKLISKGASVNATDGAGMSPLCHAIVYDNGPLVRFLLKSDADCFVKTKLNQTPLHLTALHNNFNMCQAIIEASIKQLDLNELLGYINSKDFDGNTAVHFTALIGNSSLLLLLLKKGAMYDVLNNSNQRPVDLCSESIKEFFDRIDKTFSWISQTEHKEYVRENVRIYKWVRNARNCNGYTAFCCAVVLNQVELIDDILYDKAADLHNMITSNGSSALHIATKANNIEIVNKILDYMSTPELVNFRTFDTMDTALHMCSSVEVAEALLSRGATYCLRNRRGLTPQDCSSNEEVARVLERVDLSFKEKKLHNDIVANDSLLNVRDENANTLRQVIKKTPSLTVYKAISRFKKAI